MAKPSYLSRHHMAYKARNIYYLTLHRTISLTPDLENMLQAIGHYFLLATFSEPRTVAGTRQTLKKYFLNEYVKHMNVNLK